MTSIAGYKITTKKGQVVDELVGHYPRKVLNKYRLKGLIVRKMVMPKNKFA